MKKLMQRYGSATLKLFLVLGVNATLFMMIPVSQVVFGMFDPSAQKPALQKRIIAEVKRPPEKKEQPKPKPRLRQVQASSAQKSTGNAKRSFTPDLAVGAGGEGVALGANQLGAEVFEEGEVDVEPIPQQFFAPQYPKEARDAGIEGEVVVDFVVNPGGNVTVTDVDSPHPSFTQAVMQASQQWRFSPAEKNGVPVAKRMRQAIDYALN